jgi:CRP-like cAMP-binding protein
VVKTFPSGRRTTIRFVSLGETFGESVLFHQVYPSTTETMKPSRVYRFPACDVRQLMLAEPELALAVMGSMARLLVVMNERIEELLLPAAARLARYLLDLCPSGDRSRRHLPVSKRELARRLGVTPETLSRTLGCLAAARSIEVQGRAICVLDRAALERVAQH